MIQSILYFIVLYIKSISLNNNNNKFGNKLKFKIRSNTINVLHQLKY